MNHYTTTIHIRCPFQPVWDYYEVELLSCKMVQCEVFEYCCDEARGQELTQERTADFIRESIRERFPDLIFNLNGQWLAIKQFVLDRDKNACSYCGEPATTADHVIPFCNLGASHPDNLVAVCTRCNSSKSGTPLGMWKERRT